MFSPRFWPPLFLQAPPHSLLIFSPILFRPTCQKQYWEIQKVHTRRPKFPKMWQLGNSRFTDKNHKTWTTYYHHICCHVCCCLVASGTTETKRRSGRAVGRKETFDDRIRYLAAGSGFWDFGSAIPVLGSRGHPEDHTDSFCRCWPGNTKRRKGCGIFLLMNSMSWRAKGRIPFN